jgi:hypothetical protein
MTTPVIFLVFNRPELTARVFARIRDARPAKLFVVCDGPRAHVAGEAEKVNAVRDLIVRGIDWPCEVQRNFSETNMGCRARVSSGLNWAFSKTDEAIILEDDCLPDPTFFPFCEELLVRYRDDSRVLHIGANNFNANRGSLSASYHFSRYGHIWGWATWRRAWQLYEWDIRSWKEPAVRERLLARFDLPDERGYWGSIFDRVAADPEKQSTWDFQWTYTCWKHEGLAIYPNTHLVQNIGQGVGATHTQVENPVFSQPAAPLSFPLKHPAEFKRDAYSDRLTFRNVFMPERPLWQRVMNRLKRRGPAASGVPQ